MNAIHHARFEFERLGTTRTRSKVYETRCQECGKEIHIGQDGDKIRWPADANIGRRGGYECMRCVLRRAAVIDRQLLFKSRKREETAAQRALREAAEFRVAREGRDKTKRCMNESMAGTAYR